MSLTSECISWKNPRTEKALQMRSCHKASEYIRLFSWFCFIHGLKKLQLQIRKKAYLGYKSINVFKKFFCSVWCCMARVKLICSEKKLRHFNSYSLYCQQKLRSTFLCTYTRKWYRWNKFSLLTGKLNPPFNEVL